MASPSHEPTSTDSIHTQKALATAANSLQTNNCREYAKNAWLYLKKELLVLSTTQSTVTTSALYKFVKRHSDINKKLLAPLSLAT